MADFDTLKATIVASITKGGGDLLDGNRGDVRLFIEHLGANLATAAIEGNRRKSAATIARMRLAGERMRIRANRTSWDTFSAVLKTAAEFAISVVLLA